MLAAGGLARPAILSSSSRFCHEGLAGARLVCLVDFEGVCLLCLQAYLDWKMEEEKDMEKLKENGLNKVS